MTISPSVFLTYKLFNILNQASGNNFNYSNIISDKCALHFQPPKSDLWENEKQMSPQTFNTA